MSADLLEKLKDRQYRQYIIDMRNTRRNETYQARDDRIREVDRILRGEFRYKIPSGDVIEEYPMITNLSLTYTQDVSRLVMEQAAGIRAPILGDKKVHENNAALREMVSMGYWQSNRGELLEPQLAQDLVVAGAAYLYVYVDDKLDVPHIARIDPRVCYPTIYNGVLSDLLAIQVVPAQIAHFMYPHLNIDAMVTDAKGNGTVEMLDYLSANEVFRVVVPQTSAGYPEKPDHFVVVDAHTPPGCVPVAYAQLPSHDGAQRGLIEQLGPSLEAKNKIASLLTKYLEDQVFTPFFAQNVLNAEDTPGPETIYQADPNAQNASMERIQAAAPNQTLYALMETLDIDQRALIGYPESRSGVVGQSIASGSFVDATQGTLSTAVKNIQGHIGDMREQAHLACAKYELEYKNYEKPLITAVANKTTYLPSEAYKDGFHKVSISYGPNAGLSRGQADVRDLQFLGARVIAKATVREHVGEGYLKDRLEEQDRIELETAEDALQQLYWPDPNIPMMQKLETYKLMKQKGMGLVEASEAAAEAILEAQAAAQTEAPGPEGLAPEGAPAEPGVPEAAPAEGPPQDVRFAPPPLSNYFVNSGG